MNRVLGRYRITYPKYNVSQVKNLISHEDYVNIYIPMSSSIKELESEASSLNRKKHGEKISELLKTAKSKKKELSEMFGSEFFTTSSPIWESRNNGGIMFLSNYQGGNIEVVLELL